MRTCSLGFDMASPGDKCFGTNELRPDRRCLVLPIETVWFERREQYWAPP